MRFWEASFLYFTPVQKQFQLLLVSLRWTGGKYFQLKIFHNLFLEDSFFLVITLGMLYSVGYTE